jgi:hypothetical protein
MNATTAARINRAALACLLASICLAIYGRAEPTNSTPHQPEPTELRGQHAWLEGFVLQTAAESEPEFTRIFTELGLSPETSARFRAQLTDLHRKAIEAGEPMRELLEARFAYDQQIRAALGDEKYRRYRDYEESKPARRELELFRDFAVKTNNLAIDPALSEKIVQLFKDTKATTTETWHGPYDPRPRPEVGLPMIAAMLWRQLADYRQASSNLTQALPKSGLPEQYQDLLKRYCSCRIAEQEEQTARISIPEEEFKRRLLLDATRRSDELMMKRRANSTNLLY